MTNLEPHNPPDLTEEPDNQQTETIHPAAEKYNSQFGPIDRQETGQAGLSYDSFFSSAAPETSHWSIAWSDLMMTMFVLFLSMFVYQAAHQDFLVNNETGIIGGDTAEALRVETDAVPTLPFSPIMPEMPITKGASGEKKLVSVPIEELEPPAEPEKQAESLEKSSEKLEKEPSGLSGKKNKTAAAETKAIVEKKIQETKLIIIEKPKPEPEPVLNQHKNKDIIEPRPLTTEQPQNKEVIEPRPLTAEQPQEPEQNIQQIFDSGQKRLASGSLEKFASMQLVPDQTVRIILTGDLLFETGSAELSKPAISSLKKIAEVLQDTPYMINVVGHTDNTPMHSASFASNWELSVSRASTVARFLIDRMDMNPNQFVVSGYSSYRPLRPNNNTGNRAKNRRVEIIVSKRLPAPLPADTLKPENQP
ncbi:MAG: hypothetical protein CSB24_06765 [Deltaproteobacteria bacterium]|nr:MAG: hypothetical protein CSB24_06765 [Deltaproteobacteria bacterium]